MKILLISANVTRSPYPVYPIGMSMVAAALVKSGHTVRQSDFLFHDESLDAIKKDIEAFGPELVGISVRNIDNVNMMNEQYYIQNVKKIVDAVRETSDSRVLLGGSGFSLMPDLILQETGADYGVVGEGEEIVIGFAENASKGIFPAERLLGSPELLSGPMIGPALYDQKLFEFYNQHGNIASVQTKRGCSYKCVYCSYPLLEGSCLRSRDSEDVVDEIEYLRDRFGAGYFFFVDSVFNDGEGAYLEVLEEMLRRGVSVPWSAYIKPGGLTEETVGMMKKTGLAAAEVGSDAACDTTLREMGKDFLFRDIAECNELLTSHEIAASHFFMFGGPGETEKTVREGIVNILSLQKCVSFIFMGIRVLPQTPLEKIAIEEKVISPDEDLLKPVYYISPHVDKKWMEDELTAAFDKVRHCVFPPHTYDSSLQVLHKLGYSGPMWELLLPDSVRKRKRSNDPR
jgi:lipid biosynthesis B12-binding/radical SAM protein